MVKRAFILETLSFTHSDNSATEPPLIVTLARVVIWGATASAELAWAWADEWSFNLDLLLILQHSRSLNLAGVILTALATALESWPAGREDAGPRAQVQRQSAPGGLGCAQLFLHCCKVCSTMHYSWTSMGCAQLFLHYDGVCPTLSQPTLVNLA